MKSGGIAVLVVWLLVALSGASEAACNQRAAASVTSTMNDQLATIIGFTMVQCVPAQDAGKCSIICITTSLEGDANVNILLAAITASAAVNMRRVGLSNFSTVAFADKNLLQRRRYVATSAASADRFQSNLARSSYSPPQIMSLVRQEYTEQAIPKSQ